MKKIAFIPAKGNSEGIPKKNLQRIGGLSLIEWSFHLANESSLFDEIIISTESFEVIENLPFLSEFSQKFKDSPTDKSIKVCKNLLIHKRDFKQAQRNSKTSDLIMSYLTSTEIESGDTLMLLQPTSPFRSIAELNAIINISKNNKELTIVSCNAFESPHPEKSFKLNKSSIIELDSRTKRNLSLPRQELNSYYVLDGAYYYLDLETFITSGLISDNCYAFVRNGLHTVNIDTVADLEYAKYIFTQKRSSLDWIPSVLNSETDYKRNLD